ncbi:MAG: hypothetical protein KAI66_00505 [Lentisphaeria bacterium]|nr:hypothetical protein [Lentisphaeria bacterium]
MSLLVACSGALAAQSIPLRIVPLGSHHVNLKELVGGEWEVTTTGGDPYVLTAPLTQAYDHTKNCVFAFEMFCPTGLDFVQLFHGPPRESHSEWLRGVPKSEAWTPLAIPLETNWEAGVKTFRIDFGRGSGVNLRIRNIVLRERTAEELRDDQEKEARDRADRKLAEVIRNSLQTDFSASIQGVEIELETITVRGRTSKPLRLRDMPMHLNVLQLGETFPVATVPAGAFSRKLPRFVPCTDGGLRDRSLSRWILCQETGGEPAPASPFAWATDTDGMTINRPPALVPASKKGLGGVGWFPDHMNDLVELGCHSITVNIHLPSILKLVPGKHTEPRIFNGRTYHVNLRQVRYQDRIIRFAHEHGIVPSIIVLIPRKMADERERQAWVHPDSCAPGIYTMANVTSPQGVEIYAAALDFLSERYAHPDARFGRVSNWIIHNEVDAGWIWTNAGTKRMESYLDLYHRSLRTAYYTIRRYDPHGRVFISLTHHWTETSPKFHKPREMLTLLGALCRREGDFEWGVAYHPYPQNLRDPRSWLDKKIDFTFDTPLITFRNLEVLDAWMKRSAMLFRGKPRGVLLSEQGPNSPDLGEESQALQAAGMVYFWHKVKGLDTVEAFQNHRWIDHAHEGGLLLGLRAHEPGSITTPAQKKRIWHVFQALGTPAEAEATEFAKTIIGIRSFDEIPHKGIIPEL